MAADHNGSAARIAGLRHVTDREVGLTRKQAGAGFAYFYPRGRRVRNRAVVHHINSLAIPPAYTDVWICPDPDGHIQATGRDARGRKQYRYHPRWRAVRDTTKFERMLAFGRVLPRIRKRMEADLSLRGVPRDKVLATVVRLLETTLIRVGSEEYARANKSYGLTTLCTRHVDVEGAELRFQFRGKSGITQRVAVSEPRLARIVWQCQDLPGQLYPAEQRDTLDLTLLDRRDLKPVGYQRVNKDSGKVVSWDDIVKGYEYEKDQ